jgi:hypothetical protein
MRYIQGWENGPADDIEGDRRAEALIDVQNEMMEVFTKDIRSTDYTKLGLQYVKSNDFGGVKLAMYPLTEAVTDYVTDPKPFAALMDVLAKSDCQLVQALRIALAERFIGSWADEVVEVQS